VGSVKAKHMLVTGLWFGGFQALMPLIGYLVGSVFEGYITAFDHWIAFLLLSLIGANMIKEAISGEEECADASLCWKIMLTMAVATSIDALAVGITFALLPDVNIFFAVVFIGVITFALSAVGVKIGSVFGSKQRKIAEILGGSVLILIGLKILLEHLGVINF
jgi:putative Mn2+ efflux pump MntP